MQFDHDWRLGFDHQCVGKKTLEYVFLKFLLFLEPGCGLGQDGRRRLPALLLLLPACVSRVKDVLPQEMQGLKAQSTYKRRVQSCAWRLPKY
jgi:hypothetical protein